MAESNPTFLKIIARWFSIAFVVFVLTVLTGAYLTLQVLPKVYTATAEIQVYPQGGIRVESSNAGGSTDATDLVRFQTEFQIIQSPDVLLPVITDLNLDQIWAKRFHKGNGEKLPPLEALAYMQKILKIDMVRGTNIVRITASSEVPKEAADIANAVTDRYKTMRDAQEDQRNTRGTDSLREQIDQQQKAVDNIKTVVDKLGKDLEVHGIQLPSGNDDRAASDLDTREKDLLMAKEDADARRVLFEQVKNLSDDEFINTLSSLGRQDANTAAVREELLKAQTELENLRKAGVKDTDPQITELQTTIDFKKQMLKDLIAGMRRGMEVDLEMAKSRVILLQKEVDDLKVKTQQEAKPQLEPYRQAYRDYKEQLSLLDALKVRLKQVESDKRLLESPVRIISRADAPSTPSSPHKALCLAVTVVSGILLGALVATVTEIGFWISRRSRARTS